MAVELGPLVAEVKEHITLDSLKGKLLAIDAYNTIYQFLSIIRQPDGMPLKDTHGNVTSHLSGLFYRTIDFLQHGIVPVYVFDGKPPMLKIKTIEARMNKRESELEAWNKALERGLLEEARQHAMASTTINKEIVESAKQLLDYMGIAWIQAPSEGEAQAAHLAKSGAVYAAASQDYDLFLFGSPVVVRNLAITGRRKLPKKNVYVSIKPERILLSQLLSSLGITQRQLIWLGMLVGTDFNEGIPRIGPKTALKIVKKCKSIKEVEAELKKGNYQGFEEDAEEVERIFLEPEVEDIDAGEVAKKAKSAMPNKEGILHFMCDMHDFDRERVEKFADLLIKLKSGASQKSIFEWA